MQRPETVEKLSVHTDWKPKGVSLQRTPLRSVRVGDRGPPAFRGAHTFSTIALIEVKEAST